MKFTQENVRTSWMLDCVQAESTKENSANVVEEDRFKEQLLANFDNPGREKTYQDIYEVKSPGVIWLRAHLFSVCVCSANVGSRLQRRHAGKVRQRGPRTPN